MVTIQDVARAAGVSPMTVSNVINDHRHVKEETRQRVLEKISALDYRVNIAARNLRIGRTGTIGLAVPEVDRPYYGQLASAIITEAAKHKLRVVIEQTGASRENELDTLALSRNRLYDGLILSTVGLGPADTELLRVDYPVVILGERIFEGPVDHVAMPNVEGARAATSHLIDRGCRNIAILDGRDLTETSASSLRLIGYRRALEDAGIAFDPQLVTDVEVFSLHGGRTAGKQLITSGIPFDGVFCVTDTVAIGMLRALADAGITVPEQVKVIGFDNIEETAYSIPSLSTVDPDHCLMARTAVEFLVDRIARKDAGAPQEFVSRYTVIDRDSTAALPSSSTAHAR